VAGRVIYLAVLTVALAAMWAVLSDKLYNTLILGFGIFGILFALGMSLRMGLVDGEGVPFTRIIPFLRYWGWLGGEIVKANIAVVKATMKPDLDIQPVLTRVPVTAKSDLARTTFANSITLTPGTVTVEVEERGFLVHALTREFSDMEGFREMEARSVDAAEGRSS
jgi:multicomponent Na+:H+ antiporter subunit E